MSLECWMLGVEVGEWKVIGFMKIEVLTSWNHLEFHHVVLVFLGSSLIILYLKILWAASKIAGLQSPLEILAPCQLAIEEYLSAVKEKQKKKFAIGW